MRVRTLEIRWHNGDPIYACDFQPLSQAQLKKIIAPRVVAHKENTSGSGTSNTPVLAPPSHGIGQSFRFATGGSDNNVRIWMVYPNILPPAVAAVASSASQLKPTPHPPRVEYLATLVKHAGAVNVVRFSPNGEYLASAGDDGMIIIWVTTDRPVHTFGADPEETQYEKEYWKPKIVLRCTSREVYDLAWSPTGEWLIAGSTDNTARVYSALDGACLREIAEHNHYVQGVAWDPLNEYIASQSSDRSVHVYSINTKRGSFDVHAVGKNSRVSVRHSRTPSGPTPGRPTYKRRGSASASEAESFVTSASELKEDQLAAYMAANAAAAASLPSVLTSAAPAASAPISASSSAMTPNTSTLPLLPTPTVAAPPTPTMSIISTPSMLPPKERPVSRRSSFSNSNAPSPAQSGRHIGRSPSPMPPLPAIRAPQAAASWASFKMYGDESYTNFFRRLTFSPDGAFLFTPAGQLEDLTVLPSSSRSSSSKQHNTAQADDPPVRPKKGGKASEAAGGNKSCVFIYSRANFNRQPLAVLPGHQKASIAVKFSPLLYELRPGVMGPGQELDTKRVGIERGKDQSVDIDMGGSPNKPPAPTPESTARAPSSSSESVVPSIPPPRPASQASIGTPEKPIYAPAPRLPSASPSMTTFARESDLDRRPPTPAQTPSTAQPVVATASVFALPYRMLYAVATQDTIAIHDTQQAGPICLFTNLHYASFTDMSWAPDGQSLMLASSDGYCSIVVFDDILPLYHTQQHNLQLQSIVQSHTVSPSHVREHSFSHGGVPPHSPALSFTSSLVRGSTPGLGSSSGILPPMGGSLGLSTSVTGTPSFSSGGHGQKRTERSDSISNIPSTPALGLHDLGTPASASTAGAANAGSSIPMSASSSVVSVEAPRDADTAPAKKKRRIALTQHTEPTN
ncbi:hypothetical protein FRB99_008891 [Tulasnella sp. 403]|nr:hypothetical protein FRB99_008891 [Tulasnella sp. 403]